MIGEIVNLHALIAIPFLVPTGNYQDIECVIDTGFSGFLTLPPQDVATLQLPLVFYTQAHLADHSEVRLPVYEGTILWNDTEINVNVLATGERPLLGTALLKGHELRIQFTDDGFVTIEPL
jgi:clan AA aspartic protease